MVLVPGTPRHDQAGSATVIWDVESTAHVPCAAFSIDTAASATAARDFADHPHPQALRDAAFRVEVGGNLVLSSATSPWDDPRLSPLRDRHRSRCLCRSGVV
jgi:hypothetical protein